MSRKRTSHEMSYRPNEFLCYTESDQAVQAVQAVQVVQAVQAIQAIQAIQTTTMTKAITDLTTTIGSLEETIRHQRYALDSLKKEVSDLQVHALHGAFSMQGCEDRFNPERLDKVCITFSNPDVYHP